MPTFGPGYELPGNLSVAGLAHESTFNTATPPTQLEPFSEFTLEPPDTGLFYPKTTMGVRETEVFPLYGQVKATGNLGGGLFPVNGILAWIAAVGTDGSQSGTAAATAKNGTVAAAAKGATTLTYTVTNTTPAPAVNDIFVIGPSAVGTLGATSLGTIANPSQVVKVTAVSGTGPYTLTVDAIPYAITATNDIAQAVQAPFFHAVIPTQRPISLTVERNIGGYQSQQYTGTMVNTYKLTLPTTNAEASFTAGLSAAGFDILDTPSAVESLTDPAPPFVFAEGSISLFGTTVNTLDNLSFELSNEVKENWTVSSPHLPTFVTPTSRTLKGDCSAVFFSLDDPTYGYFKNWNPVLGTPTSATVSITLAHPSTGGSFFISFPQVNVQKVGTEIKEGDIIKQTLSLGMSYQLSSTSLFSSYFTNASVYAPY